MSRITDLKAELDTDPLTRGYAAMNSRQVMDSINAQDRDLPLTSLSGDAAFSVTDTTEFAGLTSEKKSLWLSFCGRESIDPFGAANVAFVQWIFGAGATVNALNAMRTVANGQTRGQEIGVGRINEADVEAARALP